MKYVLMICLLWCIFGCKEFKCKKGMHNWIVDCSTNKKPKNFRTSAWLSVCKDLAQEEFCYEVRRKNN